MPGPEKERQDRGHYHTAKFRVSQIVEKYGRQPTSNELRAIAELPLGKDKDLWDNSPKGITIFNLLSELEKNRDIPLLEEAGALLWRQIFRPVPSDNERAWQSESSLLSCTQSLESTIIKNELGKRMREEDEYVNSPATLQMVAIIALDLEKFTNGSSLPPAKKVQIEGNNNLITFRSPRIKPATPQAPPQPPPPRKFHGYIPIILADRTKPFSVPNFQPSFTIEQYPPRPSQPVDNLTPYPKYDLVLHNSQTQRIVNQNSLSNFQTDLMNRPNPRPVQCFQHPTLVSRYHRETIPESQNLNPPGQKTQDPSPSQQVSGQASRPAIQADRLLKDLVTRVKSD